jgi:hypothetical protein
MEFPIATFWNFNLQLSVFLSYNKYPQYLAWIFTNAPNLGKAGYIASVKDFLPGSAALPEKVFTPQSGDLNPKKYAWEED